MGAVLYTFYYRCKSYIYFLQVDIVLHVQSSCLLLVQVGKPCLARALTSWSSEYLHSLIFTDIP